MRGLHSPSSSPPKFSARPTGPRVRCSATVLARTSIVWSTVHLPVSYECIIPLTEQLAQLPVFAVEIVASGLSRIDVRIGLLADPHLGLEQLSSELQTGEQTSASPC